MARTYTVYTVVYDDPRRTDGMDTSIARFRSKANAERFAAGKTCYGTPTDVQVDSDVPARLAERWTYCG